MAIDSAAARKKIESIPSLPTLPSVAKHIVATAANPKANASDIGAIIEQDQALTTKVLKLVNSSYYGFPQQIKTVNHAIVILGFNKVRAVALTALIFDLTKGRSGNRLHIPSFWIHSLGTAISAQSVAGNLGLGITPEDAFVAGLLHDFGKLILDQYLTEEYTPVLQAARERHTLLRDMEREILGFDHQQVGAWATEKWMFPPALVAAIRYHHAPSLAPAERGTIFAVHMGDALARILEIGSGGDDSLPVLDNALLRSYRIDEAFYRKTFKGILDQVRRAREFINLIEEG
jgi:putative nucleotidyltransferase with HDIG domain